MSDGATPGTLMLVTKAIALRIATVRRQCVLLDSELAAFYEV